MENTSIEPWPKELPHGKKMEMRRVENGTNLGQIAYVLHPSNNYGEAIFELVTHHHGRKYVHRFDGDIKRAMDMVRATLPSFREYHGR